MIKPFKKLPQSKKEIAQTMVEFAIVFPIILLITYGIIEFGRMVFIYAAVTGSAREGARYGAAAGSVSGTPQFVDCQGIRDAVHSTAFLIAIPDNDIEIRYDEGHDGDEIAASCEDLLAMLPNNSRAIGLGDRIIVTVNSQYEPIIGGFLGVNGFPITAENSRTILVRIPIAPYP